MIKLHKRFDLVERRKDYDRSVSNAEIDICLNCPLPECNQGGTGKACERFRAEYKKLKEKRVKKLTEKGGKK